MLPLEDLYTDIIAKAQRGLRIDDDGLAAKAGVPLSYIERVKAGTIDEVVFQKIASVLNLHAGALICIAKNAWKPEEHKMLGLEQFTTPFEDFTVNSYLIWDPETKEAAAFDTGTNVSELLRSVEQKRLSLRSLYITHTHADHIAALPELRAAGVTVWSCSKEPVEDSEQFEAGREFVLGHLKIETKQTWGHSQGGVSYFIRGLKVPVAVVGDALFAGSMGGAMVSYTDALATNRRYIMGFPDNTIVCPGHGPITSVEEEKIHNPFFPEFAEHKAEL